MNEREQFDAWAAGENKKQLLQGISKPVDYFVHHPWRACSVSAPKAAMRAI